MLAAMPFLTAYDPSDLPGGSIDPLGFDRGYALLADKILPGLTNVASRPRYFSTLCAAILIADEHQRGEGATPRARRELRTEAVLRLERFWVLASALAARSHDGLDNSGIRGIRYVERAVARLDENGESSSEADYRLLSRQMPYGMLGIYGTVADNLKLIARDTLALGPDLGRRLGEAFLSETDLPMSLRHAAATGGRVSVSALAAWGERAHLSAPTQTREAQVLAEALRSNDTRSRMAELLRQFPGVEAESELGRLRRVHEALATGDEHPDLREALRAILAFEDCYRLVLLVFLRMLWSCRAEAGAALAIGEVERDPVMTRVHAELRGGWQRLHAAFAEGRTTPFVEGQSRLVDVRAFLEAAARCDSPAQLATQVLLRHRTVQSAKLQGGRPKMPWIELSGGKIVPTLTSAQRVDRPPESVAEVPSHPYRTSAADHFLRAGGLT